MSKVKILITESQLRFLIENSRLDFLKNQYGFISKSDWEELSKKDLSKVKKKDIDENKKIYINPLKNPEGELLALLLIEESVYNNPETGKREINKKTSVRVGEKVFEDVTNADPTDNKEYVGWLLKIFTDLIKRGELEESIRFVDEDLPQVKESLTIFSRVKNKKVFKEITSNILGLPKNVTDINQYTSAGQLFKALEKFTEQNPDQIGKEVEKFIQSGEADVVYEDSRWIVYVPHTRDANCVIGSISSICTSKKDNTFFDSYTRSNPTPDGKPSKMYIIMNKNVLKGYSKEVYQFHFETYQLRNRFQTGPKNESNTNFDWVSFLDNNIGLRNFFKDILENLAKQSVNSLKNNKYLKLLMEMGEVDDLFEFINPDAKTIDLTDMKLSKLPDNLDRFKYAEELNLTGVGLKELPSSIGGMTNLETLFLANNNLKSLPESIGNLKKLIFLVLKGNDIRELPKSIENLDESKGGNLARISLDKNKISSEYLEKLRSILPETNVTVI